MSFKNFKSVDFFLYGRGSFSQLDGILQQKRNEQDKFILFIVDLYFKDKKLVEKLPNEAGDEVFFFRLQY